MRMSAGGFTMFVEEPVLSAQQAMDHTAANAPSRRVALCVAGLAVATALVLTSLARALEQPPPAPVEFSRTQLAAEQFYDAVNEALLTGDGASLRVQAASDARFADPVDGEWVSIGAFAGGLGEIGKKAPGTRLEVVSLTVHGQDAVAKVRIANGAGPLVSVSNVDHNGTSIDQLTVRNGVVTELIGGTASLRSSNEWFSGFVPRIGMVMSIGMVTVTLASGATLPLDAPGTLVGMVREGTVLVSLDEESPAVELVRNDVPVAERAPSQPVTLHRGDRFTMPAGTSIRIGNESQAASTLQVVGLWDASGLEPGTAVKNHYGRFSSFLVDGPAGGVWEGATGGQATMDMKLDLETGQGSKHLSVVQVALGAGAGLTERLQGSNQHQIALVALQGTVVIDPTNGSTGLDVRPAMLEGPAGMLLSQHAVSVQQVGALPAVLLIIRIDRQDGISAG
jgi:hypothetical protein